MQPLVTLSSTKSEYIPLCDACKEVVWFQGLHKEACLIDRNVVIHSNNQSAIHLSKNPVYHERTKHVAIKYHFIMELFSSGEVFLVKVQTADNPADLGTKFVTHIKFKHYLKLLWIE